MRLCRGSWPLCCPHSSLLQPLEDPRDIRNLFPALPQRPANQQRQKQPGKDESNPLSPFFVLGKIFNKYKQPRKNDQNPYALFGPWQKKKIYIT